MKISKKRILWSLILIIILSTMGYLVNSNMLNGYEGSSFRNLLEIVYFICNPLLLIAALFGLKQLKIAEKNISVSMEISESTATRESFKLAAEQCNYYFGYIIPLLDQLHDDLKAKNIESFGEVTILKSGKENTIKVKMNEDSIDLLLASDSSLSHVLLCLNSIESFSLFFVSRVADESVAFSSLGNTYCSAIEKFLPLVVKMKGKHFSSILELYLLWNERIERYSIGEIKEELERKLEDYESVKIKSIGT